MASVPLLNIVVQRLWSLGQYFLPPNIAEPMTRDTKRTLLLQMAVSQANPGSQSIPLSEWVWLVINVINPFDHNLTELSWLILLTR